MLIKCYFYRNYCRNNVEDCKKINTVL
ncbi:hypothetical protein C7Y47_00635 [Lysinibacillus sphaericus]|uniref:Uncharacterized protein n=1 Tax=Lysinibacillus sphaericus TaxID=1421 RepID=A0A544V1B0_LYSSH|nr:hypothetical protein C7Y47_00635 [Lysinibacillus sp. SDF0037]